MMVESYGPEMCGNCSMQSKTASSGATAISSGPRTCQRLVLEAAPAEAADSAGTYRGALHRL